MKGRIESESEASREFNQFAAVECVEAALAMLRFMPDSPEIGEAYRTLPWWVSASLCLSDGGNSNHGALFGCSALPNTTGRDPRWTEKGHVLPAYDVDRVDLRF